LTCAYFVTKSMQVDPLGAGPVCVREGALSPNCIAAKLRPRPTLSDEPKGKTNSTGFQSF
jgi:hypothetical protein